MISKVLMELLEDISIWFSNFGFNAHGILVEDDIENPEELMKRVKSIIREERSLELLTLVKKDWVAVEMARRKRAFHLTDEWDKINLWGLFSYTDIKKYLKKGLLINNQNFEPENVKYWVIPSKEYWENAIKPIVDKFTVEELQDTFEMSNRGELK